MIMKKVEKILSKVEQVLRVIFLVYGLSLLVVIMDALIKGESSVWNYVEALGFGVVFYFFVMIMLNFYQKKKWYRGLFRLF